MERIGIFAGTFDPPTLGHLNILLKAKKLCDRLIVAVGVKPSKNALFSVEERVQMMKKIAPDVAVESYNGLVVDFAKTKKAHFLIRGLRSSADFDAEFQMAQANRRLSGIETLFLIADDTHSHISSTLVREIAHFHGPLQEFVPNEIQTLIRKKFS
ncbi:MAG: pantetheine-phosphate adenylyltransferase [Verrucomicrobia bacterium]|nr:pantetheine-phosphate adenylyltransferase [Verrucomicrobiota bacterium]